MRLSTILLAIALLSLVFGAREMEAQAQAGVHASVTIMQPFPTSAGEVSISEAGAHLHWDTPDEDAATVIESVYRVNEGVDDFSALGPRLDADADGYAVDRMVASENGGPAHLRRVIAVDA